MDIKELTNFIAIAENGSISKAARELHISQPPLTKQLQRLETELNVTLFERTSKGVTLTKKGRMFYRRALSLIAFSESIFSELNSKSESTINIGMISSSSAWEKIDSSRRMEYLLIEKYLLENDDSFSITEGITFNLLELLEKHLIDLAIIRTPFDMNKFFEYVKLIDDELVVVGRPTFLNNDLEAIRFETLYSLPIIAARRWVSHIEKNMPESHGNLDFKYICDDNRTALSFATKGLCVALLPKSTLERFEPAFSKDFLISKSIAHTFTKTSLYLVYDKDNIFSTASQKFVDFVIKTI